MSYALKSVTVSRHAVSEAIRDFRVPQQTAEEWVRANLRKATFISEFYDEEGKPCRLFGFQRIAFVLADVTDFVYTVYPRHWAVSELQAKVEAVVSRMLRQAERKEKATERRVRIEKARLEIEAAECRWKMEITPSAKVIAANNVRLTQINEEIAKLDTELEGAKKEKASVVKSVVAYI